MKDMKNASAAYIKDIQEQVNDLPEGSRKEQATHLLAAYEKNIARISRLEKTLRRKQEGSNAQKETIYKLNESRRKKEDHERQFRSILRNAKLYGC